MKTTAILLFFAVLAVAVEPNFISTTVYKVGKDEDANGVVTDANLTTTTYSDGLGRELQTKVSIAANKDLTTCTFYDDAGRPFISTKAFVDQTKKGLYLPGTFDQINTDFLKVQYATYSQNNEDPKAFTKTFYSDDPLGRVVRSVAVGAKYHGSGAGAEIDHATQVWYFGVAREDSPRRVDVTKNSMGYAIFTNGFLGSIQISTQDSKPTFLDALQEQFVISNPFTADHYLTITKDPDGNLTQEIKDVFGNTVATFADPSSTGDDEIIAEYKYNILGNLLEEIPPKHAPGNGDQVLMESTKYYYNTLGQVVRKESPDCGPVEYDYDDAGNLILQKTYNNASTKVIREIRNVYDEFNRLTNIQLKSYEGCADGCFIDEVVNIYDSFESLLGYEKFYNIPAGLLSENNLHNLRGRLVATIAFNRVEKTVSKVVDLFDYNDDGLIATKYKIIPGLGDIQRIKYEYDIHGKVLKETLICGTEVLPKEYKYDKLGRIKEFSHRGRKIADYEYDELMKLFKKNLTKLQVPQHVDYAYTIQDQLSKIAHSGSRKFEENISYDGSWSGNITRAEYAYDNLSTTAQYNQGYSYDNTGRLLSVNTKDASDVDDPAFEAGYTYDNAGRLKSKVEGAQSVNDGYIYYTGTNRLKKAKTQGGELYLYDGFGNCVIDMSKKMIIEYDWRNMPVSFIFYRNIPAGETNNSKIKPDAKGTYEIYDSNVSTDNLYTYCTWATARGEMEMITKVFMLYDASGNRVMKISE